MKQKSFYLTGQTSLLASCLEILLERNQKIVAVVSQDAAIQLFCKERDIPCYRQFRDIKGAEKVDYLLSIANPFKLKKNVLSLAKESINYHDSLLPAYAGVNSTAWAIYNNEKIHGVSWHQMTDKLDAGNLLKQKKIRIEENETTLSLNNKCYQAAVETFKALLNELLNENAVIRFQNLDSRTYYAANKKIQANGWIDWNETASTLYRSFRALSFGAYENSLGLMKFFCGNSAYIADRIEVGRRDLSQPSGSILSISSAFLQINASDRSIIIRLVKNIDGSSCNLERITKKHRLEKGKALFSPSQRLQKDYQEISATLSKDEKFWVSEIEKAENFVIPFVDYNQIDYGNQKDILIKKLAFPKGQLDTICHDFSFENFIITGIFIYLYRITHRKALRIDIEQSNTLFSQKLTQLVSNYKPIALNVDGELNFLNLYGHLSQKIDEIAKKVEFLQDIYARYPKISSFSCSKNILIQQGDYALNRHLLTFTLTKNGFLLSVKKTVLNDSLRIFLENMVDNLKALFLEIISNRKRSINLLPLLSQKEKNLILNKWNSKIKCPKKEQLITNLFENQVKKTPNNVALEFEGKTVNYLDLNRQSNQFANYLLAKGIKTDEFVIVSVSRGIEMIVALLGILKIGAVYVPIDLDTPINRKTRIIEETDAKLIIDDEIIERFLDEKSAYFEQIDSSQRNFPKLAYLLYTSGTTGKPKGVMVNHKSLINTIKSQITLLEITKEDTLLNFFNLSFDGSLWEIFCTLLSGAKLILAKKFSLTPGKILNDFLREKEITKILLTPSVLYNTSENNLPKLNTVVSSGESCSLSLVKKWGSKYSFFNAYGPTEATIYASIAKISDRLVIGKPISNINIYILDDNLQMLPMGVLGEICIGGLGVSQGYFKQKHLTSEKFFVKTGKSRFYKTGDLGKFLPDGNLEYIGRNDSEIKFLGIRFDLKQIENLLKKLPVVNEAIAIHVKNKKNQQIHVYYTKRKNKDKNFLKFNQSRDFLSKYLPHNLLPSRFFMIEKFPINRNGKVDKEKLLENSHENYFSSSGKKGNNKAKFDEATRVLIKSWEVAFGSDHIDSEDDFFLLGGDSITAMRIIANLSKKGFKLSINDIYECRTISKLHKKIYTGEGKIDNSKTSEAFFPLSPIQSWFFDQNFSDPDKFNQVCLINCKFLVSTLKLHSSLIELCKLHSSLKLNYFQEELLQSYSNQKEQIFYIRKVDISNNDKNLVEDTIKNETFYLHKKIKIDKPLMIGVSLINNQKIKETKIVFLIHHLLVDAVSWRILINDLFTIYHSENFRLENRKKDYYIYQKWVDFLYQYNFLNAYKFWDKKFYIKSIPVDYIEPINNEKYSESLSINVCCESLNKLRNKLVSIGSDLNQFLIAVLLETIWEWIGHSDVIIDVESHGRDVFADKLDLSAAVGWFTSLYPLAFKYTKASLLDIILMVREKILSLPFKGLCYGVLRYFKKMSVLDNSPICFNYWGNFDESFSEKGKVEIEEIKLLSASDNHRPYLLNIDASVKNNTLQVDWTFSRRCFYSATIQNLTNIFQKSINNFLSEFCCKKVIHQTSYPLSSLQKGLLFHEMKSPNSRTYVVQLIWRSGDDHYINPVFLKLSCQKLVNDNDILRTFFSWGESGNPVQAVMEEIDIPWVEYNWDDTQGVEAELRLKKFLDSDRQAGFDFSTSPLIRFAFISLKDSKKIMVITVHHILIDGWSLPILFSQLSDSYDKFNKKLFPDLRKSYSFSSYIDWQKNKPKKPSQKFWKSYLGGIKKFGQMPLIDIGKNDSTSIESRKLFLSQELADHVRSFCKVNGFTLNTFFQGLWSLLLYAYSREEVILFGNMVTQRSPDLPNSHKIVGLLANTLPIRANFQNTNISIINHLKNLQKDFSFISEYHYSSLSDLEKWLKLDSIDFLFNTLMIFENYPLFSDDNNIFKFSDFEIIDHTHYPLVCKIFPSDSIKIFIDFDSFRIKNGYMKLFLKNFQKMITEIIEHYSYPIRKLKFISDFERKILLYNWNDTKKVYKNLNMKEIFERQVEKSPDKIALIFKNEKFTYSQVNCKANFLAKNIVSKNVLVGDCAVLYFDRCPEMIIAMIALIKIGVIYIPLSPDYPVERIKLILQDCRPKIIVTKRFIWELLEISKDNVFFFCEQTKEDIYHADNPNLYLSPQHVMYSIYTSGSTGNPKGVLITHESLVNLLYGMKKQFQFNETDRHLINISCTFDISCAQIYLPLITGGCAVLATDDVVIDGYRLKKIIHEQKISILQTTPIVWQMLIAAGWKGGDIRCGIGGGERMPSKLCNQLLANNMTLYHMYGPTEGTVWTTFYRVSNFFKEEYNVPIGKPLPNIKVYVLDQKKYLLPIGAIGELHIAGKGVSKGYLNNSLLTKEKFIPNPIDESDSYSNNDRCYATGDLVRWLPDGNLEYIGRIDDQIKIRGFRVELGEVQTAIEAYENVLQAFVVQKNINDFCSSLFAYYITKENISIDKNRLVNFLLQKLPRYMIPSHFVKLREFPLTSGQKIDKTKILEHKDIFEKEISEEQFENKIEKEVKIFFSNVLNIASISLEDDFFLIGGNSLAALKLIGCIKNKFNISIFVNELFSFSTVKKLSSLIYSKISEKKERYQLIKRITSPNLMNNCLVALKKSGNSTPLFLIHPIGGTVFWYIPLIKYINLNQPVYAIQDPAIEDSRIDFDSVEEIARFYLKIIKRVQPHGPYLLAGASSGANISVAIAHELSKIGESAAFIGLFDGWAIQPKILSHQEFFESLMRSQFNQMHELFNAAGIVNLEKLLNFQWRRSKIHHVYSPPCIKEQLSLFKAKEILNIFKSNDSLFNQWEPYSTCPIALYEVPGNHETMFQEPHVATLAKFLNESIFHSMRYR